MADKTKEELLAELTEAQKMLEEKTETQGQMIRKLQMLITNEGLFAQVIDFFPYPIAIFTPEYTLAMVNKAFTVEAEIRFMNLEKGLRILRHNISDTLLATAVTRVFTGDIFYLEDLKNSFSMFSGIKKSEPQPAHFRKAVIFPVPADNERITHGVIVFIP